MSPSKCVILVPVAGTIEPSCENTLDALEKRGYTVRRTFGYAAIDFGRSIMATDALADGFEELIWCDSDLAFQPNDVERLRSHRLPIVAGVCAKKNGQDLACVFPQEKESVSFGTSGGLCELRYAGFGFVSTHRSVFETIRERFQLPNCDNRFQKPVVPYFLPMICPVGSTHWYLPEDYAFCERAKQCGLKIMADTSINLGHIGKYQFTWRDVLQWKKYQKATVGETQSAPRAFGFFDGQPPRELSAGQAITEDYSLLRDRPAGDLHDQETDPPS